MKVPCPLIIILVLIFLFCVTAVLSDRSEQSGLPAADPAVSLGNRADANGVPTDSFAEVTEQNLDEYLQQLLDGIGRSPQAIYQYVRNNFTYREKSKLPLRAMAIRMFNTGSGACYDFAAATIVLLNAAGYEARMVTGESRTASEHDWVLYSPSPGVWRHMDACWRSVTIFDLTDNELEQFDNVGNCSYIWDRSEWTTTTSTGRGTGKMPLSP